MSDDNSTDNSDRNQQNSGSSLISQVEGELRKSERDAVKAKLKDILKKKVEAVRTVRLMDLEMEKIIADFNSGI